MADWTSQRQPEAGDADLHGMVLWGKQAGLLMHWSGVRAGEHWAHSSAWTPKQDENSNTK